MTVDISQSPPPVVGARQTGRTRATDGDSSLCSACRTSIRPGTVTGDRVIGSIAAVVVVAVAAFAAIISYSHIYDLARAHGQAGVAARLLPLSVDGLILAASLVMLLEARTGRAAPVLARVMLGLGVAATIAANVAYGAADGLTGAAISAWPAIAFIGCAELLVGSIRRTRPVPVSANTGGEGVSAVPVPDQLRVQAVRTFADDLAAGGVPSIRAIRSRMHVGQHRAQQIRDHLAALNGQPSELVPSRQPDPRPTTGLPPTTERALRT
jgi:Protein of unknown function (DUF2637)